VRRRVTRRELLRRLEALEALHRQPTPAPHPGQETIPVPTIGHHTYLGPGPCQDELFGTVCGQHRDAHHLVAEEDMP
jgi:hypothetical protein